MQAVTLVEISCLRWEHSRTDVARRLDPAPLPADCHRAGACLICYGKVIVSACTGQLPHSWKSASVSKSMATFRPSS